MESVSKQHVNSLKLRLENGRERGSRGPLDASDGIGPQVKTVGWAEFELGLAHLGYALLSIQSLVKEKTVISEIYAYTRLLLEESPTKRLLGRQTPNPKARESNSSQPIPEIEFSDAGTVDRRSSKKPWETQRN